MDIDRNNGNGLVDDANTRLREEKMKVFARFIFYMLCIVAGDFTILFAGWYFNCPVIISYILGGLWGFCVGHMGVKEWKNK